jgi:hypothetical protein
MKTDDPAPPLVAHRRVANHGLPAGQGQIVEPLEPRKLVRAPLELNCVVASSRPLTIFSLPGLTAAFAYQTGGGS